jgi:hypothetical protein
LKNPNSSAIYTLMYEKLTAETQTRRKRIKNTPCPPRLCGKPVKILVLLPYATETLEIQCALS